MRGWRILFVMLLVGILAFGLIDSLNLTELVESEDIELDDIESANYPLSDSERSRVLAKAIALSEPEMPNGIKRVAYAALYNTNMHLALGDGEYRLRAANYARYLVESQGENGVWKEIVGEPPSTYFVLESSMATWALSDAYLADIARDSEVRESIVSGADWIVRKVDEITPLGYKLGLKPNALAFMAIALSRAHLAAREIYDETGDRDVLAKAERYSDKATEISDALIEMQRRDGSWYDGPYHVPRYKWKTVSAWYQSLAWSGVAYTSSILEDGKRKEGYRRSVVKGIRWSEKLRRSDGCYKGFLYSNGTLSDDDLGSIMVLQGLAIASANGIDVVREFMSLSDCVEGRFVRWDPNLAFAYSVMLGNVDDSG